MASRGRSSSALVHRPRDPSATALYTLVAEQRATFANAARAAGAVPSFVHESFERFLRCGVLAHGFARFGCVSCGHDHLVPLSCKTRGLCPSCGGRRMATLTRHVMDFELPHVPVRQWVLSLPYPLRYRLAYDHSLCTAIHRALARALRQHLRRLARERGQRDAQTGSVTARLDGLDLHGQLAFGAGERARIERLVRYCARPSLANDRLEKLPDGRYLLTLKTRWRDGTTHLRLDPIELMERLAAQIPKPRINLVLYAGVLAPNAKLRAEVVRHARPVGLPDPPATETQTRAERETWAELMRVTFQLDVLACPRCGGRLRHIATILDARVACRILEHLGLPARAPPCLPARNPPPFWPAVDEVGS